MEWGQGGQNKRQHRVNNSTSVGWVAPVYYMQKKGNGVRK